VDLAEAVEADEVAAEVVEADSAELITELEVVAAVVVDSVDPAASEEAAVVTEVGTVAVVVEEEVTEVAVPALKAGGKSRDVHSLDFRVSVSSSSLNSFISTCAIDYRLYTSTFFGVYLRNEFALYQQHLTTFRDEFTWTIACLLDLNVSFPASSIGH
jgi:hypothetical protein